jgi:UDP-glucose 4-epimerase
LQEQLVPRALITGAAGFIGSNLSEALLARNWDVIGLDNLSQGTRDNLQDVLPSPAFQLIEGDVRDAELVARWVREVDAVVHLAAFKIPRYGNTLETLEVNSRGTWNVLRAAAERGCRTVVASTSDVYGNNPVLPFHESSDLFLGPTSVRRWAYATSKLVDEHLVFAFQEAAGLPAVAVRFFGGYGPRQNPSWWGGPQAAFIAAALRNEAMQIHGDGKQTRSFTYVMDHVDGLIRCLESEQAPGEVFNLGHNHEITILELAKLVWSLVRDDEPKIEFVSYTNFGKYQDVRRRVPDCSKARDLLGFRARTELEEGLQRTVDWQRSITPRPAPGGSPSAAPRVQEISETQRVMVTGAAGFIGANLCRALVAQGHEVVGLDNFSQGRRENVADLPAAQFSLIEGDVRDAEALHKAAAGTRAVVHLAEAKIPRYGKSIDTLEINIQGTENALEAARVQGARFILGSTDEVYGKAPVSDVHEESPLVLGQSDVNRWSLATAKTMAEHLTFAYEEQYGLPVTILRYFGGYGPYQDLDWHGGPQCVFLDCALSDKEIPVHGDGLQTRTFTSVHDLVKGTLLAMNSPYASGEIFNIASRCSISIINLAYLIWRVSGAQSKPRVKFVPYTDFSRNYEDVRHRTADISKARYLLGYEPATVLEEGLVETVHWQRQRKSN